MELFGEFKRLNAIHLSNRMATKIARDLPQIMEDYKQGHSLTKILNKYSLESTYGLVRSVARSALSKALTMLIENEEERKELNLNHKANCGYSNLIQGKGIFSLSEERKKEASQKAGNIAFKMKKGIHALSSEERSRFGKLHYKLGLGKMSNEKRAIMSRKSTISRGYVPWEDGERLYFMTLCGNSDFFHNNGSYKGHPNYKAISIELYRVYHIKRNPGVLKRWRRLLEEQNFNEDVFL